MARRYAIIGCGAVGGYYGGCLQRAGVEVHILLHHDYAHVAAHGLRIESPRGDFTLPHVRAHAQAGSLPACDVVAVALKTTSNHLLPGILAHALAPGGTVLLLQNGLGEEDRLAGIPGVGAVLGGLCFLCSHKIGPGHIRHLDYGYIALGEFRRDGRPAGITPAMRAVADDFAPTGIEVRCEHDLARARWQKLVWNVPFNGLAVALNADTRQLMDAPALRPVIRGLMDEVVAGAAACGHTIGEEFISRMLTQTEAMAPYQPSMKLDFDAGRPLELASIYAAPVAAAAARGVHLRRIDALRRMLAFLADRRTPRA